MAVVGSTVIVDFHVTEDTDLASVRAVVRRNERAHPELAETLRQAVETRAEEALKEEDVGGYDLSVGITLVTGRVPGAPRERLCADLDVEGENEVVAAVDDALSTPERARLADHVEGVVGSYLRKNDLSDGADVIVSVTPIEFR